MPKRVAVYSTVLLALFLFTASTWAGQAPTNIILIIGDGMGPGQVTLARLVVQAEGKSLAMDSMKTGAMVQTRSASSIITDSAAAGTALATGWKTNNGMVSVLPDETAVLTILEVAQKLGKSTGLVTTSAITDATPAVFASHVGRRGGQPEIAQQLLEHGVNALLGGGRAYFVPESQAGSRRKDAIDLLGQAKEKGYTIVETRDDLVRSNSGRILGLFQMADLTTEAPEPELSALADKAIRMLSENRKGFFLMVEGGQIDTKAHVNDVAGVIKQMREFDAAVGVALTFARRQGKTLVIVTADHETGGLILLRPAKGSRESWSVSWTTKGHSGTSVPLLAEGPGASDFGGVLDNTDVPKIMAKLWKVRDFPQKRVASTKPGIPRPPL